MPTPLNGDFRVDEDSVARLVRHHLELPVKGLFVAGTCGEGPWLRDECRWRLLRAAVSAAEGRLRIAMQVSDNSSVRILENIEAARENGADLAVIAEPYFLMNRTPGNLLALYERSISESSLPVCIYNRGQHANVRLPMEILAPLYALRGVVAIKDSSSDPVSRDIALAARRARPELRLMNGDEFLVSEYFAAGYDAALLGGCAFNACYADAIRTAWLADDAEKAIRLNVMMKELNWAVYGGQDGGCWLAGVKTLLVKMGIFTTAQHFLNYPLSTSCAETVGDLALTRSFLSPSIEP